jgi:hypothetical protein
LPLLHCTLTPSKISSKQWKGKETLAHFVEKVKLKMPEICTPNFHPQSPVRESSYLTA